MREGKILLSPGYAARSRFTPRPTISKNGRNSWCSSKEGSRQRWGAVQTSTYKPTRGTNHPWICSSAGAAAGEANPPPLGSPGTHGASRGTVQPWRGAAQYDRTGSTSCILFFFFFLRCKRKVCISNPSTPSTAGCLQGAMHSREAGGTAPR